MKKSIQPADPEHPYGHGKIEHIASLFQAVLLSLVGMILIGEGVRQILFVEATPDFDAGILVMVFSGLVSYLVGSKLAAIGRETDSPLLQADAFHFTVDTYSNAGVFIALILAQWKGWIICDRLVAILIGAWVMISSFGIGKSAIDALMDKYISPELQQEIESIIMSHFPEVMGYHKMRTRRSGSQKLIDLHLLACKEKSLPEAHRITDHIEKEIEARIKNSDVMIHIEPCDRECPENLKDCTFRRGDPPQ